jgi:hypothetical protein
MAEPRFTLGQIVATPDVLEACRRTGEIPQTFSTRHAAGDWGDLDQDDKAENDRSVEQVCRILSAYHLSDGTKIWVITEADRSSTCLLLPDEY